MLEKEIDLTNLSIQLPVNICKALEKNHGYETNCKHLSQ